MHKNFEQATNRKLWGIRGNLDLVIGFELGMFLEKYWKPFRFYNYT